MKIKLTSVFVDDQEKALRFYTEVLGFGQEVPISATGPIAGWTVSARGAGRHPAATGAEQQPGGQNISAGNL